MACGVFHKASRGMWSKVKGVFGRIGRGIKNVATKAYDWISNNRDKIQQGADVLKGAVNNNKFSGGVDSTLGYLDKGMDIGRKLAPLVK